MPSRGSAAGVAARATEAVQLARELGPNLGLPAAMLDGLKPCDRAAADLAACRPPQACIGRLADLYGALVLDGEAPASDAAFVRRTRDRLASQVADAALGLGSVVAAQAAGSCDAAAPPPAIATEVLVAPDRRTLRIRPVVVLRPGDRYALALHGLSSEERAAARATMAPRSDADSEGPAFALPGGTFEQPLDEALDGAGEDVRSRSHRFAERLEADARSRARASAAAGVQVRLRDPLRPRDLDRLRAEFVPVGQAGEDGVGVLQAFDGWSTLGAERARLEARPCDEATAERVPDPEQEAILGSAPGVLFRGQLSSVRLASGDDRAEPERLPFLLALPRDRSESMPVVLAVDGFTGSSVRSLKRHGPDLLRRGLGILAIDLPEHGARGDDPKRFLVGLEPDRIARNSRQSAMDVFAAVRTLRDCGIALPDGDVLRRDRVSYLGYSLGAMVGVLARSLEPSLGASVLVAPAGDVARWLMPTLVPELGGRPYVSCLGGADQAKSCFPHGRCAPPGVCTVDPFVFWQGALLELPYGLALAGADPLDFARRGRETTGAPLLIVTGGRDGVLHPLLQSRLADAYALVEQGPRVSRAGEVVRLDWPDQGHGLVDAAEVQDAVHDFLSSDGSRLPAFAAPDPSGGPSPAPGARGTAHPGG